MTSILQTFLAFCLYGIASLTFANDIATADKLYDQGKVRQALQIYLKPKYNQNPFTQNRLGNIYLQEEFRDEKKAVEWFRKSANQGNMYGQYNLGLMYRMGDGVPQDYQQALQWFSKAAKQGSAEAMISIGHLYEYGTGVKKDETKAMDWYMKVAEKGNQDGQCHTAGLYMHGIDIKRDNVRAKQLLEQCLEIDPDNTCCLDRMANMYSMGWGVERDRKKARELREKAAALGSAMAMYDLGANYDYGLGVEKDPKAAMAWYLKAAEKGESYAMYRLHEIYTYGNLGQPVDKTKAAHWKTKTEAAMMKEQGLSRKATMDTFRLMMEEK